jgi:hypothetical protein
MLALGSRPSGGGKPSAGPDAAGDMAHKAARSIRQEAANAKLVLVES